MLNTTFYGFHYLHPPLSTLLDPLSHNTTPFLPILIDPSTETPNQGGEKSQFLRGQKNSTNLNYFYKLLFYTTFYTLLYTKNDPFHHLHIDFHIFFFLPCFHFMGLFSLKFTFCTFQTKFRPPTPNFYVPY